MILRSRARLFARLRDLRHAALRWRLVRAPAQKFGPMAKSAAGEMVVLHLDHEHGVDRLPLARPRRAPSARAPRGSASEPGATLDCLDLRGDCGALVGAEARREPDVVEETIVVVQPE